MTLRAKLAVSVGCALALSIVLTLFLTWHSVSRSILSAEEEHFSSVAETVENNLESSYQEYLTAKVRVVMGTKREIRSISMDALNDLRALESTLPASEVRVNLSKLLLCNHDGELTQITSESVHIDIITVDDLRNNGFSPLLISPYERNVKQQSIRDMLASLPQEGEFGLWQNEEGNSILLFFLPVDSNVFGHGFSGKDRILVAGLILRSLFHEADAILQNRLKATRHNFDNLRFYDAGFILLRSNKGEVLIQRGDSSPLDGKLDELCALAHENGHAMGHVSTENGDYLCHIAWIQSYHWYFIMAAPVEILQAPSSAVMPKLFLAGLIILLAAVSATSFLVVRFMRPLHELRDCTSELASVDPSSTASLAAMEDMLSEKLNIERNDELGDLARSFASMGRELIKNIRSSIEVMTAQKRMEGELSAARDIQMGILPNLDDLPQNTGFSISAFLEPAREVGGDLYDCFTLEDGRKVLALGDVSGKGVPAALFMTMSVTLLRSALHSGLPPAQAMTQINTLLEEHNPGNMFVTLFLAIYTPQTGELIYANGGHCLPLLVNNKGGLRKLEHLSGPLVGVMPGVEYVQFTDVLAPQESCFFYTDGLTEAMNKRQELYGEDRLNACLAAHANDSPRALHEAVFADICAFRGEEPPSDDITMMTICRTDM